MQAFITTPNHKGFSAKRLFDKNGKIKWGAIAYIEFCYLSIQFLPLYPYTNTKTLYTITKPPHFCVIVYFRLQVPKFLWHWQP